MKNAIILSILLSTCITMLPAQDRPLSSVPVIAGRHLQANYPDAVVEDWYSIDESLIKVRFLMNENCTWWTTAIYTIDGTWKETWACLPLRETPEEILEGATMNHPGYHPVKVIWCSTPERTTQYEVVLENQASQAILFQSDVLDTASSVLAAN
ncbi:MAG: hypothetical protein H6568_05615 [Lewinellaceae bacterium]|nr:hypothetical protein [Saprospiraceae bacterium]MCB9312225.1 hypothetical protein [Lewinellaceae bacterium]